MGEMSLCAITFYDLLLFLTILKITIVISISLSIIGKHAYSHHFFLELL